MRITMLFLGRNGAGPKYSYQMLHALAKEFPSVQYQAVIPNNIDNLEDWKHIQNNTANVDVCYVKTYSGTLSFLLAFMNVFKYRTIANLIKSFHPNWIYLPMGSLLNPGIFLFLKNIKKIYTLHDPNLHQGEESFFIEFLRKQDLKTSDEVILLNNFYKRSVSEKYQIPHNHLHVIPHAGFFRKEEPKYFNNFTYQILFLGRVEKYKGISLLLESFIKILAKMPQMRLTIAGSGDLEPYQDLIQKIPAEQLMIQNQWLTENEMEDLLENTDFVVLPYIDASQSGVIPLAFGNGRTVLATAVGALSEQVPQEFGYLSTPDADVLAEQILNIYQKGPEDLKSKNMKARTFALNNLRWEDSAKLLMKILN